MPSQIRVNSITDLNGSGATELTYGAIIPSGALVTVNGGINIAGLSTVSILFATNTVVSGVVTATSFVGDGSGLTGVQSVGTSKSIAFAIVGG